MGASIVHQDNQVTLAVMTAQANFSLSFIAFEPSKKRGAVSIVCLRNVADREASTQHSLHRPCPHFIRRVSPVNHGGIICRHTQLESTLMLQIYCDVPYQPCRTSGMIRATPSVIIIVKAERRFWKLQAWPTHLFQKLRRRYATNRRRLRLLGSECHWRQTDER